MPAKTKTKIKKKVTKTKSIKREKPEKSFHVSYLAIAIVGLVLLEGLLFSCSTTARWKNASEVLDVSSSVAQCVTDMRVTLAPVVETVNLVNQFYSLSTDAAMELLDLKGSQKGVMEVYNGVSRFYHLASIEMETLLGLDRLTINSAQAAEIAY
jgi:predicted DNA-binding ArsR family transcriptional regulator